MKNIKTLTFVLMKNSHQMKKRIKEKVPVIYGELEFIVINGKLTPKNLVAT